MGSSDPLVGSDSKIVLFDGVCNLCNGAVQFIIKRDPKRIFSFASLQSSVAANLLRNTNRYHYNLSSILVIANGQVYDRSDAVLIICGSLKFPWNLMTVFRFLPRKFRNYLYDIVSGNRYRWFGKQESCMLPTVELRARFIDQS